MEKILKYIEDHKDSFLEDYKSCLRFQSVSADPSKSGEIMACAKWCADRLKKAGFKNEKVISTKGAPIVYADWLNAGKDKPTVLIYGHYDVQPADPIEKWTSPPFEPTIRNGRIYARGAEDDKGQMLTHIFAADAILNINKTLPVNIKVFLEGEEEAGTDGTSDFVKENLKLLSCDVVVLSDTAWHSANTPTIVYGLRGITYLEVKIKGPARDLHSGVYGGRVQNPINAMAKIIAKLQDDDGRILIDGFYDDVVELTADERSEFSEVDDDEGLKKSIGVKELWGEKGFSSNERNWARPSIDVHGIWGGYSGEGQKTVIASECGFKISSRLAPNQDPDKIFKLYERYIKKIAPKGVDVEVKYLHGAKPVVFPIDNVFLKKAVDAFEKGFGKKPVLVREGASIPITETFMTHLKAPSVLLGFGVPEDAIHSPNESFQLDHFYKGIKTCACFYVSF